MPKVAARWAYAMLALGLAACASGAPPVADQGSTYVAAANAQQDRGVASQEFPEAEK